MFEFGFLLRWLGRGIAVFGAIVGLADLPASAAEVRIDHVTEFDPKADAPPDILRYPPRLKELWLAALGRPEAEMKRQAASAIAEAHRSRVPEMAQTVPALEKVLQAPEQSRTVRLSVARALIVLDARQTAPILWKLAGEDGLGMSQLVEPALARWDYAPAREAWISRLEAKDTRPGLVMLAIECLARVRDPRAVPLFRGLVRRASAPADFRLQSAAALGTIQTEGLEDEARRLMSDRSPAAIVDRLVAARLLARHRGSAAQSLLLELAGDPEPAVAAIALGRLLEIDPLLVKVPMLQGLVTGRDANVRRLAAEFLARHGTPETVALLGPVLDDEHPAVRAYARDALVELAKAATLDAPVRQAATKMLATSRWRGLEQAAMVLGALHHKPAASRLIELLDFRIPPEPTAASESAAQGNPQFRLGIPWRFRPPPPQLKDLAGNPANIAAAWALRCLALPETARPIAEKLGREMDWTKDFNDGLIQGKTPTALPPTPATYALGEQLIEAVGVLRYRPFDARLREFLPLVSRTSPLPRTSLVMQDRLRGTAAWALGKLYADEPNEVLAGKLVERLEAGRGAEDPFVSRMAAISLGRMKAQSAVPLLRSFYNVVGVETTINAACGWALRRITGEKLADPIPRIREVRNNDWFLAPRE
jgi:HEAT repeat protein